MLKYTNLNRLMKITDHFKNRAQLIRLKNRVALVLAMLLLPLYLTAQITIAEKPPVDNTPRWWHLKDEMLMPYDSTYLKLQLYPTLEAYKKYIGQTLFYMESPAVLFLSKNVIEVKDDKYYATREQNRESQLIIRYGDREARRILEGKKNKKGEIKYGVEYEVIEKAKTYVYNLDLFYQKKAGYPPRFEIGPKLSAPQNKYFDIIDVISLEDIEYEKRFDTVKGERSRNKYDFDFSEELSIWMPFRYSDEEYGRYGKYGVARKDFPVFVLRETETGDTLYSTCFRHTAGYDKLLSSPLILVGGFMKIKEEFVGQTIVKMNSDSYSNIKKWTCVDVSIADGNIALVLQSENDSKKEYLAYTKFLNPGYGNKYITGEQYLKMEQAWQKKQREEEQKFAEAGKKHEAEINKRRKELTAKYGAKTAENILLNNYAMGMSKAACREIGRHYSVIDKTTTTETWVISNIFGGESTYLYFSGDKLVRIAYR